MKSTSVKREAEVFLKEANRRKSKGMISGNAMRSGGTNATIRAQNMRKNRAKAAAGEMAVLW